MEKFFLKKNERIMYFKRTIRKRLMVKMKKGYISMGDLNLSLAEEGIFTDNDALFIFEHNMECKES